VQSIIKLNIYYIFNIIQLPHVAKQMFILKSRYCKIVDLTFSEPRKVLSYELFLRTLLVLF